MYSQNEEALTADVDNRDGVFQFLKGLQHPVSGIVRNFVPNGGKWPGERRDIHAVFTVLL